MRLMNNVDDIPLTSTTCELGPTSRQTPTVTAIGDVSRYVLGTHFSQR